MDGLKKLFAKNVVLILCSLLIFVTLWDITFCMDTFPPTPTSSHRLQFDSNMMGVKWKTGFVFEGDGNWQL